MNLINKIKSDQLTSRKNQHAVTTALLTTLIGEAEMVGKNANRIVTDDEVIANSWNEKYLAIKQELDHLKAKKEIVGYANFDELDTMPNDQCVIISPVKTNFYKSPVYR